MRIIEFSSALSQKRCLKRGVGISILPEIAVTKDIENGELVRLAVEPEPPETGLIMIWHAEKWCSPLLKSFMKTVERLLMKS